MRLVGTVSVIVEVQSIKGIATEQVFVKLIAELIRDDPGLDLLGCVSVVRDVKDFDLGGWHSGAVDVPATREAHDA